MTLSRVELFKGTRGNQNNPDLLIVGEAWGSEEQRSGLSFMGHSGKELTRMLWEAKIPELKVLYTNVMNSQPKLNDFTHFLKPNTEKKTSLQIRGVYPTPILVDQLTRLEALIAAVQPRLIVGLGNWPLWALTEGKAKVSTKGGFALPGGVMSWRGSELQTREIHGKRYNFLPTIHPATVLRSWDLRHLVVHDLKARASNFLSGKKSTWGEPSFSALPAPSYEEVLSLLSGWTRAAQAGPISLSVDIETSQQRFITCLGIADADVAMCIPFFWWDTNGKAVNYWSEDVEKNIWLWLKKLLEHPNVKIIGQNFAYDSQFLARMAGIHCEAAFDTMLAHHLCFPGTPKGLDMLASLYLENYVYWKDESQEWATDTDHTTNWLYNCKDTRYTYDIAAELRTVIAHFNLNEQYDCQLAQWRVARKMCLRGVHADRDSKITVRAELISALKEYEEFLLKCVPGDLRYTDKGGPWYTSPKRTMDIFYHYLGIQPVLHKKTKRPTLDATAFEPIKKRAPWTSAMIDALSMLRSVEVFISHFLDAPLSPDGRFRTSFNVGATDTFRWSSNSNPFGEGTNLQNISKGDG